MKTIWTLSFRLCDFLPQVSQQLVNYEGSGDICKKNVRLFCLLFKGRTGWKKGPSSQRGENLVFFEIDQYK